MPDYGGLTAVVAECFTCGKVWETRNAHGIAARHAKLYGHHTAVEVVHHYSYNAPERIKKKKVNDETK